MGKETARQQQHSYPQGAGLPKEDLFLGIKLSDPFKRQEDQLQCMSEVEHYALCSGYT